MAPIYEDFNLNKRGVVIEWLVHGCFKKCYDSIRIHAAFFIVMIKRVR